MGSSQTSCSDGGKNVERKPQGQFTKVFLKNCLRDEGFLSTQFERISREIRRALSQEKDEDKMTPVLTSNSPVDVSEFSLISFLTKPVDELRGLDLVPPRPNKPLRPIRRVRKPVRTTPWRPAPKPIRYIPRPARPVQNPPEPKASHEPAEPVSKPHGERPGVENRAAVAKDGST